jgi:hypothetical protein
MKIIMKLASLLCRVGVLVLESVGEKKDIEKRQSDVMLAVVRVPSPV